MDRLYYQSCLIPAGTPQNAPVSFPFPLEDATLKRGNITVPDGHNGLTGVRVLWGSQQIWPWANNQYLVANNRVIPFDFDDYMTITGLHIEGFNTDIFDHTFYVELLITDTPQASVNANVTSATTAIVSSGTGTANDPLGPQALIDSVPPDMQSLLFPDLVGG